MHFLKKHWTILVILLLWSVLLVRNYTPGASLIGWDSLQTELNPTLAIHRALLAPWEEYQSFGLAAGMAHGADLVHAIFIWLMALILPQSAIRYGFQMLMVLVGALGMQKLLIASGLSGKRKPYGLVGAIAYMLNFNVIQMLFMPFEPFTVFFAMLPWEVWIFTKVIGKNAKKRDWLWLAAIAILSTPEGYAQQTFVVYMLLLGALTLGSTIAHRSFGVIKRAVIAGFLIVLLNSFWILPQVYFLKTASSVVETAKINQISTEDVYYANKDKGNYSDFIKSIGFFYERTDQQKLSLFQAWKTHRETLPLTILISTLFGVTVLGLFAKSRYHMGFLLMLLIVMVGLLTNAMPFAALNELLRKNMLINQIFRSPFTKFGIPEGFVASYFFAHGTLLLASLLTRFVKKANVKAVFYGICGVSLLFLIIQAFPAFQGYYFSAEMKHPLPAPYKEAMQYFKTQDKDKRIAQLPEATYWGWQYNAWPASQGEGYDGSGFLWYGVEQPIVSRNFDMWSSKSESYYWEARNALVKEDVPAFENVLEKYDVSYLLMDQSVRPLVATTKSLQYDRLITMLAKSEKITKTKQWGFLTLYTVKHEKPITHYVSVASMLPNIGPLVRVTNEDTAYMNTGDYQTDPQKPYDVYYPFLDLSSQTRITDTSWQILEGNNDWQVTGLLPKSLKGYQVNPSMGSTDMTLYTSDTPVSFLFPFTASVTDKEVMVSLPRVQLDGFPVTDAMLTHCALTRGTISGTKKQGSLLVKSANDGHACFQYYDDFLNQKYGYLVKVNTSTITGQRMFFYVSDQTNDQAYIEDRLTQDKAYYVLGSGYSYGVGYAFSFQNDSSKTVPSTNILNSLSVFLFPYDTLKQLTLTPAKQSPLPSATWTADYSVKKDNYAQYTVTLKNTRPQTIVLSQAYQDGWVAYSIHDANSHIQHLFPFLFGKKIQEHVVVNNWENGWQVSNSSIVNHQSSIIIVYWPQYLEYGGLLLIAAMSIGLIVFIKRK